MPEFSVPWEINGRVIIEADSEEAAEDKFWEKYGDDGYGDLDDLLSDAKYADLEQIYPIREVTQ